MAIDEAELQAAMAELERAHTRRYYDAAADEQAREQYYAGIDPDASPQALHQAPT